MERDTLFLLKHGFVDGPGTSFYCPECSEVNGLLHYHPELRHAVDVRYVAHRSIIPTASQAAGSRG